MVNYVIKKKKNYCMSSKIINSFFYSLSSNKCRNVDTLIHLLKGSLGTGILAMPNGFHNSGWVVGLIGTIIIGIICTYCVHMLLRAQYELCKRKKVMRTPSSIEFFDLFIFIEFYRHF